MANGPDLELVIAALFVVLVVASMVIGLATGVVRLLMIPLRLIVAVLRPILLGITYVVARLFFAARDGIGTLALRVRS